MKTDKTEKFFQKVLDKLFQSVGFERFDSKFVKQKEWYLKKEWSAEQEKEFKKYFIKEHIKTFGLGKQMAEMEFQWLNLAFGWKGKKSS